MLLHWTRTSDDLCEEEQVHGLVYRTGSVLVRVVVLAGFIHGSVVSCHGGGGTDLGLAEGLLVTRSSRMPSVGEGEGAGGRDTASGQPGGGTGGD